MGKIAKGTQLSKYVKEARMQKGLQQLELASKLGYKTGQYISNWERGLSAPPVNKLKRLAKILSVDVDDLANLAVEDYRQRVLEIVYK